MEMKNIKPEYIVYCSHAGHTEKYAKMFAKVTGLPIMTNKEAMKKLEPGSRIIYFGWIQSNIVQGYKEAKENFEICAVVSVGMFGRGTGVKKLRHVSVISDNIPLFPLKGGLEMNKLGPVYKMMMASMRPKIIKDLKERLDPSPLEIDMLNTITYGGDFVKPANLEIVIRWYSTGEYEEQDFADDFSGESVKDIINRFGDKVEEREREERLRRKYERLGIDYDALMSKKDEPADDDEANGEDEGNKEK